MMVFVRDIIRDTVHIAELKEGPEERSELLIDNVPVFFYGYEVLRQKKEEKE